MPKKVPKKKKIKQKRGSVNQNQNTSVNIKFLNTKAMLPPRSSKGTERFARANVPFPSIIYQMTPPQQPYSERQPLIQQRDAPKLAVPLQSATPLKQPLVEPLKEPLATPLKEPLKQSATPLTPPKSNMYASAKKPPEEQPYDMMYRVRPNAPLSNSDNPSIIDDKVKVPKKKNTEKIKVYNTEGQLLTTKGRIDWRSERHKQNKVNASPAPQYATPSDEQVDENVDEEEVEDYGDEEALE